MFRINENFQKLPGSYLFAEIARRVKAFQNENPNARMIRMGIGDVTQPLCEAVIKAMHEGVDEMANAETFRGYGPDFGYDFLVNAIIKGDYEARGVSLEFDEVFISDGAKCDVANLQELFAEDVKIAVTDPVYPVYVDSNAMAGRAGEFLPDGKWSNLVYLPCTAENDFVPELPKEKADVIYLCYPNNPTGTTLNKAELKKWVEYAKENNALIIYDAAYRAYVQTPDIPLSIYEIEGAKEVAIECNSFSKTAGFTGTRCAYTVVPHGVAGLGKDNLKVEMNALWKRRMATKFNGVSYPVQKAAAAVYSVDGQKQIKETVAYYMGNAKIIRDSLIAAGYTVFGGVDAPYIWLKVPGGENSCDFFDRLLNQYHIVGTPGAGFGPSGEGYFRLTAFNSRENTQEAMQRLTQKD